MYLNETKIKSSKVINKVFLIISTSFLTLFTLALFLLLGSEVKETIITIIVLIFINLLIIYKIFRCNKLINSSYFYSRYFEGDLDGYINISDMVALIRKDEKRITKELNRLLKKKYMKNFFLEKKDLSVRIVLISKICRCECKNCGAKIDKKIYFTGKCPYCGSSDLFAKISS